MSTNKLAYAFSPKGSCLVLPRDNLGRYSFNTLDTARSPITRKSEWPASTESIYGGTPPPVLYVTSNGRDFDIAFPVESTYQMGVSELPEGNPTSSYLHAKGLVEMYGDTLLAMFPISKNSLSLHTATLRKLIPAVKEFVCTQEPIEPNVVPWGRGAFILLDKPRLALSSTCISLFVGIEPNDQSWDPENPVVISIKIMRYYQSPSGLTAWADRVGVGLSMHEKLPYINHSEADAVEVANALAKVIPPRLYMCDFSSGHLSSIWRYFIEVLTPIIVNRFPVYPPADVEVTF